MRGDRMAKRSSFGKTIRKRLSDITNYQPQPKSPPVFDQMLPSSTKEYIDHLSKLQFKPVVSKAIELNGVELQKLRLIVQKTQLQNWNLAQSNSHMMAELNLGRQKLKALQHQLICKDTLLKTMKLEHQAQIEMKDQKSGSQEGDDDVDTKQRNTNRRMRPTRSQSTGPLTTVQQVSEKETAENKRQCVRRQSARFRSQEHEPKEKLFEIKDLKMHEDGPTSKVIEQKDGKWSSQESQRMSFGRPSRRAAEKIQSYKETPLNIKMRRPE
ncbi:Shugoshin, C-terminal [Cynara cardunculus var. scolymus]|uniref:Shugoshin, C-terminal n=1 Tax=Cynara cardunculus var. scolymus TaxID=59895 RepID=A0A103XHD7_CYNCS|nr:Shugoshin, C-terminal [Cynara cardunculus var. scolymus]